MFWEKEIETMKAKELRRLQLSRLKKTLRQAAKSPFYSRVFKKHRISPEKIKTLEDLKTFAFHDERGPEKTIPLRVSHRAQGKNRSGSLFVRDHRAGDGRFSYPKGPGWMGQPGGPLHVYGGGPQGDVFQNMVGYGLFTGGLGFQYGAERLGALTIPSGSGNSKRQIALMQDFETTVDPYHPQLCPPSLEGI